MSRQQVRHKAREPKHMYHQCFQAYLCVTLYRLSLYRVCLALCCGMGCMCCCECTSTLLVWRDVLLKRGSTPWYSTGGGSSGPMLAALWCYKGVTRVLQECYKSVTRVLQKCYKSVTRVLQECYKSVCLCRRLKALPSLHISIITGVEHSLCVRLLQVCHRSVTRVL
jgi:hypothetical protein